MTEQQSPGPAWQDVRFLRTHRGLLVYWAAEASGFAQAESDLAPKNLVIARHHEHGWRLVRLHDDDAEIRPRAQLIAALHDAAQSTVIEGVAIEPAPGLDHFALRQDRLYLCAGVEPELQFAARHRLAWEIFSAPRPGPLAHQLWRPPATMGGTQLMHLGLAERLGGALNAINLQLHRPDPQRQDERPLVIWLHNDASDSYRWCADPEQTARVAAIVFVSHWQRHRFLSRFPNLPPAICHVIHNATDTEAPLRPWPAAKPWRWRCAYTSAPNRGLSVLLDAWERLDPADAELHIWSGFRLWGPNFSDSHHHATFLRASRMPGVTYHGIRPNSEIRIALRDMHFLTYPATFDETACIAVMEAMAAGVRVISTARGALPETTAGFARLYVTATDPESRADAFARHLAEEFRNPWGGRTFMATAAQEYARAVYDWSSCVQAWRHLIDQLTR